MATAKRVGIVSIVHESNTFLPDPTTIQTFRDGMLLFGEQVRDRFQGGVHEISGMLERLEREGIEAVPLFYGWAMPTGRITRETCEFLIETVVDVVKKAGALDGVLAVPHGAGAGADEYHDIDGCWLAALRKQVGPEMPVICVLDPHVNLTAQMVGATDIAITYRTNPHIDQKARGLEAAELMAQTLRGEIQPVQAGAFPPIIMNIERQNTDEPHFRRLYDYADGLRKKSGVLSLSIALGFPYADVEEMGSAFVVATDNDRPLAEKLAAELADYLMRNKQDFVGQYVPVEEAVEQALGMEGPVGLLDMGDNVGGGATADATSIALALHRRAEGSSFVCIYDPEAARQAIDAGAGAKLKLSMGGHENQHTPPLETEVTVLAVSDGRFHESGVVHGGQSEFDFGPMVAVKTGTGLTISLSTQRVLPFSVGHITCLGLDPQEFQVIVAKGVHSPLPWLEPACTKLIRVNTPGLTSADITHFDWKYRRRPLFPFEEI